MSIADIKLEARRALHEQFGLPIVYTAPDGTISPAVEQSAAGLTLRARFATKTKIISPENDALSIMENVERLIFSAEELEALGRVLGQAGEVLIPDYGFTLSLDMQLDPDGPFNQYWTVARIG